MNLLWKRIDADPSKLETYLRFCENRDEATSDEDTHRHHIFPRSFSRYLEEPEQKEIVVLSISDHIWAHLLLFEALLPGILRSKAAGALMYLQVLFPSAAATKLSGEYNPNFGRGFLWWWKQSKTQEEYDNAYLAFVEQCRARSIGEKNPQFGKPSVNRRKGYQYWWKQRHSSSEIAEKERSMREQQRESLERYYQEHSGSFSGKSHTDEAKQKMSQHRKKIIASKGRLCTRIVCKETQETWDSLNDFLSDKPWSTSVYYHRKQTGNAFPDGFHYTAEKHYVKDEDN